MPQNPPEGYPSVMPYLLYEDADAVADGNRADHEGDGNESQSAQQRHALTHERKVTGAVRL